MAISVNCVLCCLNAIYAIVFYQCFLSYIVKTQHICKHMYPKHQDIISSAYIEPTHVMKKRSIDQPLRILLWYDESVFRLDKDKFKIINSTILPEAINFWQNALYVRKVENVILLARKCESNVFLKHSLTYCRNTCREKTTCGEVEVPDEHLDVCRVCNDLGQDCGIVGNSTAGPGITGFDFVFYVSAVQTERCSKSLTVAYAAHCQQEVSLDRPIAGHANFCPKSIGTKPQELEILLSTVKHEILHALGFSISLFAFYRDSSGQPLTPRNPDTGKPALNEELLVFEWSDKVVRKITRHNWLVRSGNLTREVQMIVTPRVVAEVRKHFACPLLEGAELEDQGEDGTILTHWEKRVFENEAMTGTHTQNPVISNITLALMEDTGWYRANYSMAEAMAWGRGLGCDFVMKSCKEWMSIKRANRTSIHPFCENVKKDPLQTECSEDRSSVALCNLVRYAHPLPPLYQNFDSLQNVRAGVEAHYGSSVSLADYCPYIQEFSWRVNDSIVRGSHCQFVDNNPKMEKNFALESYGNKSKCFDHADEMWEERSCRQMRQWQHWGSGCYEYKCERGRLHILVAKYNYTCYYAYQEVHIQVMSDDGWLHTGAIICPPCEEICQAEFEDRNEKCTASRKYQHNMLYDTDVLYCRSIKLGISSLLLFIMFVVFNNIS